MPATTTTPVGHAWRTLSVVSLASVLTGLGGSAVNVALPDIARGTGADPTAAEWILLGFQLTTTVLMLVLGRLADVFGRRAMYLAGLATYTAAALLSGFAPDAWTVVALRAVQAAGAAMLLTNSAALVTDAFPRSRLGEGMGVYVASFSIAGLIGPTLGGVLADHLGWRWVFWFNVPIGLACFAVGLPLFLARESRAAHPVVDLSLFRDPAFSFGTLASLLNAVARMGMVFLVALYFQAVRGDDAVAAGAKVLPLAVAAMTASVASGFLQRRLTPRALAASGAAATTCGLLVLLLTIAPDTPYALITTGTVLIGLGSGVFLPSNTTELLHGLPSHRLGVVNAMRLMLQNTGVVVGTALSLSVITAPLPAALHGQVYAGTLAHVSADAVALLVTGYRWAFACMAAVSALTVLACLARRGTA